MYMDLPRNFLFLALFMSKALSIATVNNNSVCSLIAAQLGNKVSLPSGNTYKLSIQSYWYQQERLSPSCVVSPTNSKDVSSIVNILTEARNGSEDAPMLSIRSGGHAPLPGAANNNGGVTIDMRGLANVKVSPGRNMVSVGAGAIWSDVYDRLVPMNLTVLGARVADLGVGGLLTGGGISFYSPQRGFACDHIINMEIVLANGHIINANAKDNPDLFQALKGGSNNFGIVTRFDLQLYPGGDFWGGFIFTPGETFSQQLRAFQSFIDPKNFDPYAEMISAVGYEGQLGSFLGANGIYYTKPTPNPPIFQPFTSLEPQLGNTLRISNITDFVAEEKAQQAANSRGLFVNTVFRSDQTIIPQVYGLWNATVDSIKAVDGIQYFLIFQRVPAVEPGNSLGISSSEGTLILCLLSVTWTKAEDDKLINAVAENLFDDIESTTKTAGVFNDYKYLNYAASFQDPIRSYGNASVANLQRVSKKYDPSRFFQTVVGGGFKLPKL